MRRRRYADPVRMIEAFVPVRATLIKMMERDELVWRGERDAILGLKYGLRCDAAGYFVEATLDDGQCLQSDLFDAADHALDTFEELRRRTMINRVRIIAAHTGVVFCDLPSRVREQHDRRGTYGAVVVELRDLRDRPNDRCPLGCEISPADHTSRD